MGIDSAVGYSFSLYVLFVLLPLVPAILIFWLFPESKVAVTGPLQGLTVNATGAFAAYIITGLLGFLIVRQIEIQINYTRNYPIQGVIVGLEPTQAIYSDRFYSRSFTDGQAINQTHEFHFVVVFDHPVVKPEKIKVDYFEGGPPSGLGEKPAPSQRLLIELVPNHFLQHFSVVRDGGQIKFINEEEQAGKNDIHRDVVVAKAEEQ